MKARMLNEAGLREFQAFVNGLRAGDPLPIPYFLLTDSDFSNALHFDMLVEIRDFKSRYEIGCYLVELMSPHDTQDIIGDQGYWSWLALFWFDQLCPVGSDGLRSVNMPYTYILSSNWNHRPRHALMTTWQLVAEYGENSLFLLSKEPSVRGEIIEQMMARQYFFGCTGIIRLASQLYQDDDRKTFKRGAASRKTAGCVARFVSWLQQLEVNYDLYSLGHKDMLGLLPQEFDRFRSDKVDAS